MNAYLSSPWEATGIVPALPVRCSGPIDATACPPPAGCAALDGAAPVSPWSAADVRLPARATGMPFLATGMTVPAPRPQQPVDVIDLRDPARARR